MPITEIKLSSINNMLPHLQEKASIQLSFLIKVSKLTEKILFMQSSLSFKLLVLFNFFLIILSEGTLNQLLLIVEALDVYNGESSRYSNDFKNTSKLLKNIKVITFLLPSKRSSSSMYQKAKYGPSRPKKSIVETLLYS